jgi:hypothetical protein
MKKERKCNTCDAIIKKGVNVYASTKYCSEDCRRIERSRVNKQTKDRAKARALNDLDFAAFQVFKQYKQRAPLRNLEFTLELADFRASIEKPCHYCNEHYTGLGLDRVKNNIGYTRDNVVPCCPTCNMMKRGHSLDEFISKCNKISESWSSRTVEM